MFSRKVFAITNLLGLSAAVLFKNQGAGGGPAFVYKRSEAIDLNGGNPYSQFKRSFSQQDMCERTSAMFAIRACRAYCMKNYDDYPVQCGVPGSATTVVEMANQMRQMVTLEYCQNQYDIAIQKCLKLLA